MTTIEQQQIKGITLKSLWWLIGSTATIVSVVLWSVSGIRDSISDVNYQLKLIQKDRDNDKLMFNDRIYNMTEKINKLEGRLDVQTRRLDDMEKARLFK